jgi:hypothetical protein
MNLERQALHAQRLELEGQLKQTKDVEVRKRLITELGELNARQRELRAAEKAANVAADEPKPPSKRLTVPKQLEVIVLRGRLRPASRPAEAAPASPPNRNRKQPFANLRQDIGAETRRK